MSKKSAKAIPDEKSIYQEFITTNMAILDAVLALTRIGYDGREAERMVFEWVDGLERGGDGETI
jgi:hypothetical protein